MNRRFSFALALLAALALVACSGDDSSGGPPGNQDDAASPGSDGAAPTPDAGPAPNDAAVAPDTAFPIPPGLSADETAAFLAVNTARAGAGSPLDAIVDALDTSAAKHCAYYAANASQSACVSNPHVEVSSCASYYAASFDQREKAAGYTGSPSSEVMAFAGDPKTAVEEWLQTIYHRYPIIDPWQRDFGYGKATGCDTIDFGVGDGTKTPDATIAVYPFDGQTNVPTLFAGNEGPQPNAPPTGWPSGYPVSIHLKGTVANMTITKDGDSTPLPSYKPNLLSFQPNAVFVSPNKPLSPGTKYRVHADGMNSAGAFSKDWSFTTQ